MHAPHATRWRLRGLDIAGQTWGAPGQNEVPVVLVHGFLDHAGTWDEVAALLPGHIAAPDLRGHGQSAWCGPEETYHFADYIADLDALVTTLGGRAIVVGHSLGGTIVSTWAGARPERAAGLVIVDGLGLVDGVHESASRLRGWLDEVAAGPRPHRAFATQDEAAERLRAAHPCLTQARALALASRGTRAAAGGWTWSFDPRHRFRYPTPYRQDAHRRILEDYTGPTLVITPENSPFNADDSARTRSALPHAAHVRMPEVGHMVPLEAPRGLAEVICTWLVTLRTP